MTCSIQDANDAASKEECRPPALHHNTPIPKNSSTKDTSIDLRYVSHTYVSHKGQIWDFCGA